MKRSHIRLNLILAAFLLLLISSCHVLRPYEPPTADLQGLYRDPDSADTGSLADVHWQELFTDTLLQALISEGIRQNLDLQQAFSRVREAQAYLTQSRLAFLPTINADAGASLAGSSNDRALGRATQPHQYQVELTASWEADIWGKLSSAKKASLASLLQADANAKAVQTGLIASIATDYYTLLALDQQLAVTQQSIKNWQTTVDVMKDLKTADIVTGAAVVQSEASKYAVAATVPDLRQSIREIENQLNRLLGRPFKPIAREKLEDQHPLSLLQTGIPAKLLSNRPDVLAAEYNFRYSFELTNEARTYFYPSLTLSASGGYLSYGNLFGPGSLISNLAAGLSQPIFNQGANRTRLRVAQEQQQQALLNFQNVLLQSGQEVSDALYAYRAAGEKISIRRNQLSNLRKSVEYTQELVRNSSANYTEVLTAQQNMLEAQLNQINDFQQQLQSIVSLYRSLGGGWK